MRGVLFALPEHVERFEAVLRRGLGAEALLSPGRWLPARRDSRPVVRAALRRRGWVPCERPEPRFDRILVDAAVSPAAVSPWLAPHGRVVLWYEGGRSPWVLGPAAADAAQPSIAALVMAEGVDRTGLHPEHTTVIADPRLDPAAEPGAAARARSGLGLDARRPVVVVAPERALPADRWAGALVSLRSDAQVVFAPAGPAWLRDRWPRSWTGPGVFVARPGDAASLPDLLAAADVVLCDGESTARAALACGRRVVGWADGRHGRPRGPFEVVDDTAHLRAAVLDRLRDTTPVPFTAGGGVGALASVLTATPLDLATL
jgi:hypothetical protein